MIYLVYGDQKMLVNKMADKLAKEVLSDIDDFNYVKLDCSEVSNLDVIDELTSLPLGSDNKVVYLADAFFLTGESRDNKDINEDCISFFVSEETSGITLILGVYSKSLDTRKAIVKKLRAISKVIELNVLDRKELPKVVKQMFNKRGVEITDSALDELLSRLDLDMYGITNEVEKLSTYSKSLHVEDIRALTPKKVDDNIFSLIDAIFKKDINRSFRIYNDLKKLGTEPIFMTSVIANQARFLYQIQYLRKKGYTKEDIASTLSVHPYRVEQGLKVSDYSDYELENLIVNLSKLDVQIKSGEIDRYTGVELFLLKSIS